MEKNISSKEINIPTLFLKGEQSSYIQEHDIQEIKKQFKQVIIQYINNAGHWLQADQPQKVYNKIISFFN